MPAEFFAIGSGRKRALQIARGRQILLEPRRRHRRRALARGGQDAAHALGERGERLEIARREPGRRRVALHDQEALQRLAREDRRRHRRAARRRDVAGQQRRRHRHQPARGHRSPHRVQRREQLRAGARVAHAAQRAALLGQEQIGVGDLGPQHRDGDSESLRELRRRSRITERGERLTDRNVTHDVIAARRVVVNHDRRFHLDLARNHLHVGYLPDLQTVSRNLLYSSRTRPIKLPESTV